MIILVLSFVLIQEPVDWKSTELIDGAKCGFGGWDNSPDFFKVCDGEGITDLNIVETVSIDREQKKKFGGTIQGGTVPKRTIRKLQSIFNEECLKDKDQVILRIQIDGKSKPNFLKTEGGHVIGGYWDIRKLDGEKVARGSFRLRDRKSEADLWEGVISILSENLLNL